MPRTDRKLIATDAHNNQNEAINPSGTKGKLQGHKVTYEPNSWCLSDRVKKIIAIAAIFLLFCGIFIPMFPTPLGASANRQTECTAEGCPAMLPAATTPTGTPLNSEVKPLSDGPIREFPAYLPRVPFVGMMRGKDSDLCIIPTKKMPKFETCERLASFAHKSAKSQDPSAYRRYMQIPSVKSEKGLALSITNDASGIALVTIGTDEKKIINIQNALEFVQKNVLNRPDFFNQEITELVNFLIKTNQQLNAGLQEQPGQYRQGRAFVTDGSMNEETEWREILKGNGGTRKDFTNLDRIIGKINRSVDFQEVLDKATSAELKTLKKIGFLSGPPEEVEDRMVALAAYIKEVAPKVINQEYDAIEAAAYVHQEIGIIHPFHDGNGRTARIWMNVMLQLGGYRAIILPDEEKYSVAIREDQKTNGKFALYLKKVIQWNRSQEVLREQK